MYYITGIYCKTLDAYLNVLYMSRRYDLRRSGDTLSIPSYDYHKILIRVYDSNDKSMEWLGLFDFLDIVERNSLEVDGLDNIEFYADFEKRGNASLTNPDSVKSVLIRNRYAGIDNTGMNAYAGQKMLGAEFDRYGGLSKVPKGFVKKGVLYFPDNILSLGYYVNCEEIMNMDITKVSISEDFDIDRNAGSLSHIIAKCGHNVKLHIRGDLKIGMKLFRLLHCNIEVDGILTCINLSKTYLYKELERYAEKTGKKVFYLSDPNKVYRFNIIDNTFERRNL